MKKCLKCGRDYPETSEICETDGAELIPFERIFDASDHASRAEMESGEARKSEVDAHGAVKPFAAKEKTPNAEDETAAVSLAPQNEIQTPPVTLQEVEATKSVSQWKLAIALLLLMTFGFGGFYIYQTRHPSVAPVDEQNALVADPNAKPLKQLPSPTGDAEKNIALNVPANSNGEAIDPLTGKAKDVVPPIKKTGEIYNSNAPIDSPFIPPDDATRTYEIKDPTGAALVSEASPSGKNAKNKNEKAANAANNSNVNEKNANAKNANANSAHNANAKESATSANHNATNAAPKPTPTEKKIAPATNANGKNENKKNAPPK